MLELPLRTCIAAAKRQIYILRRCAPDFFAIFWHFLSRKLRKKLVSHDLLQKSL